MYLGNFFYFNFFVNFYINVSFFIYLDLESAHFWTYYEHYLLSFLVYKMRSKRTEDWGN